MDAQPARVTIRDVADRAGVSVPTVSKVLNHRHGIARATAARVLAVVDEMGYRSSLVASSLRNERTGVIGILVTDLEPFSTELLKGVGRAVRPADYELVVCAALRRGDERAGWEQRHLSRVWGTLIDGALLVAPTAVKLTGRTPVVAVDPHLAEPGVPTVASDDRQGAEMAVRHLIELGHRRIGFVSGRADRLSGRLRRLGYEQALAAAGLPLEVGLVASGDFEWEASRRAAQELLVSARPPTAIFAASDVSALGVLSATADLGYVVPRDLSVVGFDNIPEGVVADPPLTTVDHAVQQMGEDAIALLLGLLRGEPAQPRITVPARLVRRGSAAPPGTV